MQTDIQNSERLIICGGRQRKKALDLDEWHAYETAIIAVVDVEKNCVQVVVEYQSPLDKCADEQPAIVFKAGDYSADGNRFIVCTQTEIIEFDCADWRQTFYYSHPWFNDLHHVCYRGENSLMLANTGLDQVLEIEMNREDFNKSSIANSWNVTSDETWKRFDKNVDYRKVATTKPHLSHPNFVFCDGMDWFATRFHQKDAVNLSNFAESYKDIGGNPHDGLVFEDQVYFTTTDGKIVRFDMKNRSQRDRVDLSQTNKSNDLLGWCRGLLIKNKSVAWVGFSRIRPTWFRKNLSWVKQGFQTKGLYGTQPTRISQFDLDKKKLTQEFELEKAGINAVFGIYKLD